MDELFRPHELNATRKPRAYARTPRPTPTSVGEFLLTYACPPNLAHSLAVAKRVRGSQAGHSFFGAHSRLQLVRAVRRRNASQLDNLQRARGSRHDPSAIVRTFVQTKQTKRARKRAAGCREVLPFLVGGEGLLFTSGSCNTRARTRQAAC